MIDEPVLRLQCGPGLPAGNLWWAQRRTVQHIGFVYLDVPYSISSFSAVPTNTTHILLMRMSSLWNVECFQIKPSLFITAGDRANSWDTALISAFTTCMPIWLFLSFIINSSRAVQKCRFLYCLTPIYLHECVIVIGSERERERETEVQWLAICEIRSCVPKE